MKTIVSFVLFLSICFTYGCQKDMDIASPSSDIGFGKRSADAVSGRTTAQHSRTIEDIMGALNDDPELWTTPDSIFTWAAPDSNMIIVDIKKFLKQRQQGAGVVCLKQLKNDNPEPKVVFFRLEHYNVDVSKEGLNLRGIAKVEYFKWENSARKRMKANVDEVARHIMVRRRTGEPYIEYPASTFASSSCPDWSGSPQHLWAGAYYEDDHLSGDVWTPWINNSTWNLGSYYVWLHLSYYDFANIMSSCFGDFDFKTEACGNDVYRRFVYTKKMWLYKGPAGTGGYSDLVWALKTSTPPFLIYISNPFTDGWHDDFSESANNIDDNIESVAVLMQAFQKTY